MKNRIKSKLDASKYTYENIDYPNMYITDWNKSAHKERGVEITHTKPSIDCVSIDNNSHLVTCDFFGFKDNALYISPGKHSQQCECILFPENSEKHWILCIETKYAEIGNEFKTFKDEYKYPFKMLNQIIATVTFFRNMDIISSDQTVSAIVSFPKLINDFNSQFFEVIESKNPELSITNIMLNHKIRIKATNKAKIKSEKRIQLL